MSDFPTSLLVDADALASERVCIGLSAPPGSLRGLTRFSVPGYAGVSRSPLIVGSMWKASLETKEYKRFHFQSSVTGDPHRCSVCGPEVHGLTHVVQPTSTC